MIYKRDIAREDENTARKDKCHRHSFYKVIHKVDRWKCIICGYEVFSAFVKGYEQGLKHAKGDK